MAVVTLLTDYGLDDDFVGVCHGVIAMLAPQARVIDVTHGIARHDVRRGALVLRRAIPYMPAGVHVAVVDPGVGSRRRAVALRCGDPPRLLVGPDNGLLAPLAERLGGIDEAIDIGRSPLRLQPLSATFHGRDVFAAVGARLAAGTPLADAGEPLDAAGLMTLELPRARVGPDGIVAHAIAVDRYGNVALDIEPGELSGAGVTVGRRVAIDGHDALTAATFADVAAGELLLYEDGYGTPSIAVNCGSALELLGLRIDAEVRIEAAG